MKQKIDPPTPTIKNNLLLSFLEEVGLVSVTSLDALWSFVIGPCSSSGSSSSLASSLTSSCTVESVCAEIELITASFTLLARSEIFNSSLNFSW